jgi:hypothetical protein
MKMKVKIFFLELLAISIAVMMVVSCMTPCVAVGDSNEHPLKKLSDTEKESSKSNYIFSFHGNATLLWSYVNEERDAEVSLGSVLDDINGDGIRDILITDCNTENKLLAISGKDGSTIWSKNYPTRIICVTGLDYVSGDGIGGAIIFWEEYDPISNQTDITVELLSGANGEKIWSKTLVVIGSNIGSRTRIYVAGLDDVSGYGMAGAIISWNDYDPISNQTDITVELLSGANGEKIWSEKLSYEGVYQVDVHGVFSDLNGDGIEDILVEAGNWEQDADILCLLSSKDGLKLWEKTFDSSVHGCCYAWNDLTGDGIYDFAVSCYNRDNNVGELFIIRGSDGYVEWNKSFIGDGGYPDTDIDFDGDGLNDIGIGLNVFETEEIENDDFKNKTREFFVLKGTDGSVIWSKSFSYEVRRISHLNDLNGDGIEELCLSLENFTTGRVTEVQVLNGRDRSLIWKKDVNVSDVDFGGDLNGDGKSDILFSDSTEIGKNKYLEDVIAISGVDGSEIWKSSFLPDIEIEILESVDLSACRDLSAWSYLSGWRDVNGDDIPDPSFHVNRLYYGCWDENASTVRTYSAEKVICINGTDGSEIWGAEVMADEYLLLHERDWVDFDNDGINDVLLVTGKGVYLLETT